jgi:hypothetical protein
MERSETRAACRHDVSWPVRVRYADDAEWHTGRVINLSVTGALFQTERRFRIGERVEVEIDFLSQPNCTTVVAGVGLIVRTDDRDPSRAAVHFAVECGLSQRRVSEPPARGGHP